MIEDQGKSSDDDEDFKILMTVNKDNGERALQMRSYPTFDLVYELNVRHRSHLNKVARFSTDSDVNNSETGSPPFILQCMGQCR